MQQGNTEDRSHANEHLGCIRQRTVQGLFPGGGAAAGQGGGAGRRAGLQKGGHRPSAVGDAASGRRPGGPLSGREEHLGAGGAAAAFRRAERHGPPACPGRHGGRPAPGDGLRRHRGAERPPEPGRAGAPALRHAGRRRLRRRGHAGFDGRPAHRGGAGVPPALGAVHPAHPAPDVSASAAGEPGQRQILPRPDPPGGGRRAGPGVLPGKGAGPDGRDTMPPPEK